MTPQTAHDLAKVLIEAWSKNPAAAGTLTVGHPSALPPTPATSDGGNAPDDGKAPDDRKTVGGKDDCKAPNGKDDGRAPDGKENDKTQDDGKDDGKAPDDGNSSHALALPAKAAPAATEVVSPGYSPEAEEETDGKEPKHSGDRQDEEPTLSDLETDPGQPIEPLNKKTIKQYTEGSLVLVFSTTKKYVRVTTGSVFHIDGVFKFLHLD